MPIPALTWQSSGTPLRLLMVGVVFCSHASVHTSAQHDGLVPVFRAIDGEAERGAMGYDWLNWSIEHIGHRLTGSRNGARAEACADSLFRVGGASDVVLSAFSTTAWSRGVVALRVGPMDALVELDAVALANTPADADVQLDLVDAGNGLRTDLIALGRSTHGKAVMINLGMIAAPSGAVNLHRSEKTALALEHGAAAVVFVNNVAGHVLLTGTASIDGSAIPIPAVCITSEDGAALRTRLASGEDLRAWISMTNSYSAVHAHNVITEIRGSSLPDEVVLVGGHLDSWDLATGATDNGLGSFSILDLARCFHSLGLRPARTIRFVLFMGEEQGLLGSRALVQHYQRTGVIGKIRVMVNLDMTGHPQGFNVAGPGGWSELIGDINSQIEAVDTAFASRSGDRMGLHSDHQPFLLAGVPVINPISDLGSHVYGCYHSSCDNIHLVDPQAMVNNVRFVGMLLYALAETGELPPPFSEAELRQRLEEAGLEEPLRLGGDWPW